MEKYITGERTELKYELVGDYYLIAGDDEAEEEQKPIGIWGQRHLRYLKNHRKVLYTNLLTSGKLNIYLADIDNQAEEMFERLTRRMAVAKDITEQLKATDQVVSSFMRKFDSGIWQKSITGGLRRPLGYVWAVGAQRVKGGSRLSCP